MYNTVIMSTHTYKTSDLLKRFSVYFFKQKKIMAIDLLCASLTTVCDMTLPRIMSYLTNTASNSPELLSVSLIGKLALLYAALRIVDALAYYYMASLGHIMGVLIESDMRHDLFEHLERLSDSFYSETKIGNLMGIISADLFDVTEFSHHCPEEFFIAFIKFTVSFIILSRSNLLLTLIIFACLPFMFVTALTLNRRNRKAFKAQRVQVGKLNAQVEDSLLGHRVLRAFGAEKQELEKFDKANEIFKTVKKERYWSMARYNTSTRLFDGIMYVTTIIAGGLFLVKGLINAGDFVAYVLYMTTLINTVRRLVDYVEQFESGITGIERFVEIMDTPIDIVDKEDAKDLEIKGGSIRFEKVSFEYPLDHNRVLHELDLEIKAGENLALVGESGGGKTTLSSLIPRFYDVTSGAIYIDGQNIKDVTLSSLRAAVGIVQQDVHLFSGTVYENIAYGKRGAAREEVLHAAKLAGADSFIQELKDGYDSYVGERGVKLSGGQKQRIAIARVFLKDPPILLLDEATSTLDNESEALIERSLKDLSKGRTTLTIAHRLTTIKDADRIIVLGKDGILEEGTHEDLLKKEGVYYRLWNGMIDDLS